MSDDSGGAKTLQGVLKFFIAFLQLKKQTKELDDGHTDKRKKTRKTDGQTDKLNLFPKTLCTAQNKLRNDILISETIKYRP